MSFSRLSLVLRLPLAVILCGQLVILSGNISLGDYSISITEEVVYFDEREDSELFDGGLPAATFKDALAQFSDLGFLGFGYVPQGTTPDLRATGPPNV